MALCYIYIYIYGEIESVKGVETGEMCCLLNCSSTHHSPVVD